jgi:DNA repair photolyase
MEIQETTIKKILTRAQSGFLLNAGGMGAVCSHSLQPYQGCAFGNALCGVACYVQANFYVTHGRPWGGFLDVRTNAAESYQRSYQSERKWAAKNRGSFSIFCSSSTDPFLPQEDRFGITKSLLKVMVDLPPELLILQTHTHRVGNDEFMDLYAALAAKCRLRFHISIETDRDSMPGLPPHASPVGRRMEACRKLREAGHTVVVTVAPLLPIDDPDEFFRRLADVADAVVIDHFILGDGTPDGRITKRTTLPESMRQILPESLTLNYRERVTEIARKYFPDRVGVSADGFAGYYK